MYKLNALQKAGLIFAAVTAVTSGLVGGNPSNASALVRFHESVARIASGEAAAATAVVARNAATAQAVAARAAAKAEKAAAAVFTKDVWAFGFQSQLDACRGAVDLTAAYGVPTIGEKWNCGGSGFPVAGALVHLTGLLSGTYRVGPVVAVLNAYTQNTGDIPRGYQLLYQTCRGDNAHTETFTALSRVS
jgi:hypothetical protein